MSDLRLDYKKVDYERGGGWKGGERENYEDYEKVK